MYANEHPKDYDYMDLMNVAEELKYLMVQSHYSLTKRTNEVFYVFNRALHDMTEQNGIDLAFKLLYLVI
jgi:hypothetical protein